MSTGMIWSTPLVTEYESQYGPPQLAHEPIEMTVFVVVLLLGLAYVWRKGLLKWA